MRGVSDGHYLLAGGRPANARRGQPVQFRSDKQWMENEVLDQFGSDLDEDDPTMLLEKKVLQSQHIWLLSGCHLSLSLSP